MAVATVLDFVLEVATDRWELVAVATARRLVFATGRVTNSIEPVVEVWL